MLPHSGVALVQTAVVPASGFFEQRICLPVAALEASRARSRAGRSSKSVAALDASRARSGSGRSSIAFGQQHLAKKKPNSGRSFVWCSIGTERKSSISLELEGELECVNASVDILKEGFFDFTAHALSEMRGQRVKMYLVSLDTHPGTNESKRSPESDLNLSRGKVEGDDNHITVQFSVPKDFGRPGAVLIESEHPTEFFLKSITLDMPNASKIYFPCYSWIVDSKLNSGRPRVFFSNQVYLPNETPPALAKFRLDDLISLRGDGTGKREDGERIYDYDVYSDMDHPEEKVSLGGPDLPYPRRCRTGRKLVSTNPVLEEAVPFGKTYLPRDDKFSPRKQKLFIDTVVRCAGQDVVQFVKILLREGRSFKSFEEIHGLYAGGLRSSNGGSTVLQKPDGTALKFPPPAVVRANSETWKSDQEFARQRLAGANPMVIQRLESFPPVSKLDPDTYGSTKSSITAQLLKSHLEGLTVEEALKQKKLYVLDYHDAFMPYLNKINAGDAKAYSSRTIFYLTKAGVLLPVAIELSLPPKQKGENCVSRVFTPHPKDSGPPALLWNLAKAHVAINDMCYYEYVSHWLRTHGCMEAFVIATRRQLSVMHPLYVLLAPHLKDTLNINVVGRTTLIESTVNFSPRVLSLLISSNAYRSWRFDEQAVPNDLLKRGMAERDPSCKHGLRLHIEDYPWAVDGLELWATIKRWVKDYLSIYYKNNEAVKEDVELQGWWEEIRTKGHQDIAEAEWWPKLNKVEDLQEVLTTLIWQVSGYHSTVNFTQYAYAGFMPSSPSMGRQFIPEEGSPEFESMVADPERFFLDSVSSLKQAALGTVAFAVFSHHLADEQYLGERTDPQWTTDQRVLEAHSTFCRNIGVAEEAVEARNAAAEELHHRAGPTMFPYTLLAPKSGGVGITYRGVPNSITM